MNNERLVLGLLALTSACGGSIFSDSGSTSGGSSGTLGGQSNLGGHSGLGGAIESGGAPATGGSVGAGGSVNTGGKVATGGEVSTGGKSALGGAVNTGGKVATGGKASTGGAVNTGGKVATGGSVNAGGTAATGASPGTGGTTPDRSPGAACTTASDCWMKSDCCTCDVYSTAASPSSCDISCKQPLCAGLGIGTDEVACVAGRCVFARSCDVSQVICEIMPPDCPTGQVPSVSGSCWGPCLPISRCSAIRSCDACKAAGLACVTEEGSYGPTYHCVSSPSACTDNPTCACMNVCNSPLVCKNPASTDLTCMCPICA